MMNSNRIMIKAEEIREGDTINTIWSGHPSTIKRFQEYTGPFDFILKIAEFTDGAKMSLTKGHYYECVK